MANEISNVELDLTIPELWRAQMIEALIESRRIVPRFLNVDAEVRAYGDIINVPISPEPSVSDVTAATGAITNSALTPTEIELTINQWRHVAIDVTDKANKQSIVNALAEFPKTFGRKLAEDMDDKVAALWTTTNFTTNNVGGSTSEPDEALLTSAVQKLMAQSVPLDNPNEVTWFFHPFDWAKLKRLDVFSDANVTGLTVGGGLTLNLPSIYGIPVVTSALIDTASSTRLNFLGHRESCVTATQSNFMIEMLARVRLSTPVVGHMLYGVKTGHEVRGCTVGTSIT